jgi:hypothetical protein
LFPAAPEVAPVVIVPGPLATTGGGNDQKLVDALMRLMGDERIYCHDNITIGTLATKLGIPGIQIAAAHQPAARLSQPMSFSIIIGSRPRPRCRIDGPSARHHHRVDAASSLGPFNRAFKATTGVTLTEYGGSTFPRPDP